MPGEAQSVLRVFVANGQKGNKEGRVPPPSSKSERRRKKKKNKSAGAAFDDDTVWRRKGR